MSTPEEEAQLLAEAQEQARLQEEEIHRQQHWKEMWDKCINISATKNSSQLGKFIIMSSD